MYLKKFVRKIYHKILLVAIYAMNKIFSGGVKYRYPFLSNSHPCVLLVKNLVRPGRVFQKAMYGQMGALSRIVSKARPIPDDIVDIARQDARFNIYESQLQENGIVIIDEYFKDHVQRITEKLRQHPQPTNSTRSSDYDALIVNPFSHESILQIISDPILLGIAANYLKVHPYMRSSSSFTLTNPILPQNAIEDLHRNNVLSGNNDGEQRKINGNCLWHYDTPNNLTVSVLLRPLDKTQSHLKYALKSHRYHHLQWVPIGDYEYSEEHVTKRFEILDCVGDVGTLIIFDTNGLHRLEAIPGMTRMDLGWCIGPGNTPNFKTAEDMDVPQIVFEWEPQSPVCDYAGLNKGQRDFFHFFQKT